MMKMGFELPKSFYMENRRLAWLIGIVIATIIFFQYVELPKNYARWLVLSEDQTSNEDINNSFITENSTSSSISLGNMTSPSPNSAANPSNTSSEFFINQNGHFIIDHAEHSPPPEKVTEMVHKEDNALLSRQNANFTPVELVSPVTASPTVSSPAQNLPTKEVGSSSPTLVSVHVRQKKKPQPKKPLISEDVLTLSEMNKLLNQNHESPDSMVPRWSMKADRVLALAKSEIEKASVTNIDGLYAPLYRNASRFYRSYELMEQKLKVYIYKEGDRPIFHTPALEGIYASEGWFMKLMETNKQFVTKKPLEANLFYLPFSSQMLEEVLYVPNSHKHRNLIQHLKSYLDSISSKYPFWNRTDGADHFLVACHDWAPSETKRHMRNCIRALCNADVNEGFKFGKDVSLPETNVRKARKPTRDIGGRPPSKRKILAFFAGGMHGYLRPILLHHWGISDNNNNDHDMQIYSRLLHTKGDKNYIDYMKRSKYCICPRGYEVNSPRVVEAIVYECVPVIISDNFVPPLFETLNWESFAVFVKEKDIPDLKKILLSIPEKSYVRMYMMVKKVQRHFLWHSKPVKYDLFHMILHSIWYNRVFQFKPS